MRIDHLTARQRASPTRSLQRYRFAGGWVFGQPLLPRVQQLECLERRKSVEIGGADFVEERMLLDAEERHLPMGVG